MARLLSHVAVGILFALIAGVSAWRAYVPWDTRNWCEQVTAPKWPYAYRKSDLQLETKGRIVSNTQDLRHVCQTRGAQSICHRCEDFKCNVGVLQSTCHMQIQGVDWARLPPNVPTVTDTPFAVGPNVTHRNDFGNASRVCVFTQGGDCIRHDTVDFSRCALRCWGTSYAPPTPFANGWTYPKSQGLPQGKVFTLAGAGVPGFRDGVGAAAKFNNPQGVAVDIQRNVYVADTGNHCIRIVYPNGTTATFAGTCTTPGYKDGPNAVSAFFSPVGITLYHNASDSNRLHIFVADSGNHVIRRIRREPNATGEWQVITWAGGRTLQVNASVAPNGLQDGQRTEAGFNYPRGIAVDNASNIFVADTNNHLVRWIDPTGYVHTLAGTVVSAINVSLPVCPPPCIMGVQGFDDGPRNQSGFSFPQDVAISEDGTVRPLHRCSMMAAFSPPSCYGSDEVLHIARVQRAAVVVVGDPKCSLGAVSLLPHARSSSWTPTECVALRAATPPSAPSSQ